jgi:hypothetical protein
MSARGSTTEKEAYKPSSRIHLKTSPLTYIANVGGVFNVELLSAVCYSKDSGAGG